MFELTCWEKWGGQKVHRIFLSLERSKQGKQGSRHELSVLHWLNTVRASTKVRKMHEDLELKFEIQGTNVETGECTPNRQQTIF
jgi:hypothetical protein